MYTCSFSNIDNKVDVGIVVVVASTGHFDESISHSDILCVDSQIFRCGHDGELDSTFVAECFVRPFSDRTDFLDGGDTVVGDEDLEGRKAISFERRNGAYSIPYLGDDGVTALALDKVGNLSRSSLVQRVGTYTAEQEVIRRMNGGSNQDDLPIKCATLSWSYTILSPDGA